VARVAGDEFAIVAHRATAEGLRGLAQRAVEAIAAASVGEHAAVLGASAGIALWPDDAGDADGVLRAADLAMLAAKRAGKGRVVAACEDRAAIA
jgi:diguanylate cyclase (GGDEF)-like protein